MRCARSTQRKEKFDAAEAARKLETFRDALGRLIDSGFPILLRDAVDNSNERAVELRAALGAAAHRDKAARRAALGLYVIGTFAIIAGTLLGKVDERVFSSVRTEAPAGAAAAWTGGAAP
jgi:hypothetical protein